MGTDTNADSSGAVASIAKVVVYGGIFIAFLVFSYIQLYGNPLQSMMGDNLLEAATIVDMSDKSKMDAFTNAGGLDKESSWKGFQVKNIESVYHDTGKLGLLNLTLLKTWPKKQLASMDNIRASLTASCGAAWKQSNVRGVAVLETEGSPLGLTCSAMDQGGGEVLVSIASAKVAGQKPVPPAQTATQSGLPTGGDTGANSQREAAGASPLANGAPRTAAGISTVAGELTVESKTDGNGGSVVKLAGKVAFDGADLAVNIEKTAILEGKTVALLSLSAGGTACPALFRILSVSPGGSVYTSDEFGTCSDAPQVTLGQTMMQISMPSLDGKGASAWMYSSETLNQVQGPKRK